MAVGAIGVQKHAREEKIAFLTTYFFHVSNSIAIKHYGL